MKKVILALIAAGAAWSCGKTQPANFEPDAFVVQPDPTVSSLAPDHGPSKGGTTITVTGSGFGGDMRVLVGDRLGTGAAAASDTSMTFVTPPGPAGQTVSITVLDGRGNAVKDASFTFNALPTIASVTGPVPGGGGSAITVTGTGFQANEAGTATVTVGGHPVSNVQVTSDTQLTFTSPAIADPPIGALDVVVTNANGTATLVRGYHYTHAGLLLAGDGYRSGTGIVPIYFIDPNAATPKLIRISQVPGRILTGMTTANGNIYVMYRDNQSNPPTHVGILDVFAGHIQHLSDATLAGSSPLQGVTGSKLVASGGNFYFEYPRLSCCYNAQLYRLDINTGASTPLGATFATPPRAFSMGPGISAGTLLLLHGANTAAMSMSTAGSAPVAIGPAMTGNGCYFRGSTQFNGVTWAFTNCNPDPTGTTSGDALCTVDPVAGTFQIKAFFSQAESYRGFSATPAGW